MGSQLSGLGVSGSTIFGGVVNTTALYSVNTSTGALTLIGNGTINYIDTGSTLTSLYGLDSSLNLFSVNPANGATTPIGATGLSLGVNTVGFVHKFQHALPDVRQQPLHGEHRDRGGHFGWGVRNDE